MAAVINDRKIYVRNSTAVSTCASRVHSIPLKDTKSLRAYCNSIKFISQYKRSISRSFNILLNHTLNMSLKYYSAQECIMVKMLLEFMLVKTEYPENTGRGIII